jgi:hypothetical protein
MDSDLSLSLDAPTSGRRADVLAPFYDHTNIDL